jgi:hypothetical protein
LTARIGRARFGFYAGLFAICVAIGFLVTIGVPPLMAHDDVHSVLVDGKVLLGYSNSIPTSLTFEGQKANYTATVGDISGSCACGGYYFLIRVPDHQSYAVAIYYTRNNTTHVCETKLSISTESGNDHELIRCP